MPVARVTKRERKIFLIIVKGLGSSLQCTDLCQMNQPLFSQAPKLFSLINLSLFLPVGELVFVTTPLLCLPVSPESNPLHPALLYVGIGSDFPHEIIKEQLGFKVSDLLSKFLFYIFHNGWNNFLHLLLFQFHFRFPFKV